MSQIYSLILAFIAGLFFLIGGIISNCCKDKKKLNCFSISLAIIIMLGLIFFDLGPEIFELFENTKNKYLIMIGCIILGIIILKILDIFVPDHHHEHHDNEKNIDEHVRHESHIGKLTVISLILHNILEGFAIYGVTLNNFKIGLLTCLTVALHNIPLGTHIFSSLDFKKNKLLISMLTISSLIGGIIFLSIGNISDLVLGIIACLTLGMLIYIVLIELIPEAITNMNKKETKLGILVGMIILAISSLF